jgi:hypothetical protein
MITPADQKRAVNNCRVSATSNACFEAGRIHGGKSRCAADVLIFTEGTPVFKYDLNNGDLTDIEAETAGEKIFSESVRRYIQGYEHFYDCSIAVVREPGPKARTVTSSSFFHSEFLQVFSHLSLEMLNNIPEIASGLRKSRHGWVWAEELDDPEIVGKDVYAVSTDLETSTDYLNWEVVRSVLTVFNRIAGIPTWYGNACIEALTHPRRVYYNGTLFTETKRGSLMGDPGTKSVLTLVGLAVTCKVRLLTGTFFKAVNIGDDYVGVGTKQACEESLEAFESFEMKISEDDTFISNELMYFTEELIELPKTRRDTVSTIFKTRDWSRMPYIDAIKGRLLIDAKKNRDDFSYTPAGRLAQLGRDTSYLKEGQYGALFHLASIMQDVCLDTRHYSGFVYFPSELGGAKPIPFGLTDNFIRWVLTHRRGSYIKKYNFIIDQALWESERNTGTRTSRSCLKQFTSNLQRHYDSEHWRIQVPAMVPKQLVGKAVKAIPKYAPAMPKVLGRLAKGHLISQSELVGKIMAQKYMECMITGRELESYESFDLESYEVPFEPDYVERLWFDRFIDIWNQKPALFSQIRSEDFYLREEALEIIGPTYEMHVDVSLYPSTGVGGKIHRSESRMAEDELFAWFMKAHAAYTAGDRIPGLPMAIVDDDGVILNEDSSMYKDYILISADKKLAQQLANRRVYYYSSHHRTYRIHPRDWILTDCAIDAWQPYLPITEDNYIVDQGSFDHCINSYLFDRKIVRVRPAPEEPEVLGSVSQMDPDVAAGYTKAFRYYGSSAVPREYFAMADPNWLGFASECPVGELHPIMEFVSVASTPLKPSEAYSPPRNQRIPYSTGTTSSEFIRDRALVARVNVNLADVLSGPFVPTPISAWDTPMANDLA